VKQLFSPALTVPSELKRIGQRQGPSKAKTSSKSETAKPKLQKCASLKKSSRSKDDMSKTDEIASPAFAGEIPTTDSPATPLVRSGIFCWMPRGERETDH
jgi:hypothetical protein